MVSTTAILITPTLIKYFTESLSYSIYKYVQSPKEKKSIEIEDLDLDLKIYVINQFLKNIEKKEMNDIEKKFVNILKKNIDEITFIIKRIDKIKLIHKNKWFSSYRPINLEKENDRLIELSKLLNDRFMYLKSLDLFFKD